MGVHDRRRFRAFAEFIHTTYPNIGKVADVGGGRGDVSFFLHELGHDATIIDSRAARLPRWIKRSLRRESVKQGRLVELPRVVGKVQDTDLQAFDLIVGLHPDEATEHIVRTAIKYNKEFAVVPCCVFPIDGVKRSKENWRDYLISLSKDIVTTTLPIRGENLVLYRCNPPDKEPDNNY